MERRVKDAHGQAREYLKTSALLTDVYFHFTPSQIMMASLFIADQELTEWYIGSKFPSNHAAFAEIKAKVLAIVARCADMLKTVQPVPEASAVEKKHLQGLAKKLKKCRNPEKMDLVALQKAKREVDTGDEERIIKKRRLEREKSAKDDDLFGPEIKKE